MSLCGGFAFEPSPRYWLAVEGGEWQKPKESDVGQNAAAKGEVRFVENRPSTTQYTGPAYLADQTLVDKERKQKCNFPIFIFSEGR